MSDELRLPDELAACEARLASEPLPKVRLDRDQLLYRAGWAAAEAELTRGLPTPVAKKSNRMAIAAWSFASAALAASLAVAVTHSVISESLRQTVEQPGSQGATVAAVAENPTIEPLRPRRQFAAIDVRGQDLEGIVAEASRANRRPPAAALLAAYDLPRGSRWSDPIVVSNADQSASDEPARATLTARSWPDELKPAAQPGHDTSGGEGSSDAPQTFRPLERGDMAI